MAPELGNLESVACGSPPRRAYPPQWSCGRVAEGGGLLNRYRVVKPYRGFESLRLRHPLIACASALASRDEAKRRRGATPKLRSRDGELLALTGYNGKPSAMAGRRLD